MMTCLKALLLAAVALYGCNVTALESDREQPITIQADDAMIDDRQGTSVYTGDVTIDQGTLHISAHEVEIISDGDRVIQIIASSKGDNGPLAHYEQQPDEDESLVQADARKITYFVQEERLHLVGNARLEQARDTFSGEILYYNVNKGIVNLSGSTPEERVIMTINPRD